MPEEVIQEKQEKTTKAPMSPVATLLVVGVFIIIVLMLVFVLVADDETSPLPDTIPVVQDSAPALPPDSLGGAIYEKQQNPLEDKLPGETPVANPIGDAYQNPFE